MNKAFELLKKFFIRENHSKLRKKDIAAIVIIIILFFVAPPMAVKQHQALMPGKHLGKLPSGSVPWETLGKVKVNYITDENKIFSVRGEPEALALSGKAAQVTGFMTPLEAGTELKKFILSKTPPTCFFCLPAGPDSMVYVESKSGVNYSQEAVTMRGVIFFDKEMTDGIIYRLKEAELL